MLLYPGRSDSSTGGVAWSSEAPPCRRPADPPYSVGSYDAPGLGMPPSTHHFIDDRVLAK